MTFKDTLKEEPSIHTTYITIDEESTPGDTSIVVNLSEAALSKNENNRLLKGLSFCLKPRHLNSNNCLMISRAP